MTGNQSIDELLEQGIQAAKTKDHDTARRLLEQVVEMDQHNEKGWFWLAAVINDVEERRICLNNVLMINPENYRAQTLLAKLDKNGENSSARSETESSGSNDELFTLANAAATGGKPSLPQIPRNVMIIGGAAGAFILLLIVVVVMLSGGGDDKNTQSPATAVSGGTGMTDTNNTPVPDTSGGDAAQGLPTPTLITAQTATPPPPTWTPVPSSTPISAVASTVFPAPPNTLPGTIIMESGNVPGDPENRPIVLVKADGSGKRTLTEDARGHAAVLAPDGSEYAYIEFLSGTREEILMLDNVQGTAPRNASTYWQGTIRLFEPDTPAWSPDGNWIAFTAVGMGAVLPDLYRVTLITPEGEQAALERLTSDDVIESWPAYSPDSSRIVYVADKSKLDFGNPVDLSIYDLASGTITDITTNGAELIEAAPDWAPDGQYIVFQGTSANTNDTDIYRIPAYGLGEPEKIIDSDAEDIRPHYSPDGRYIVFSSNRTGNWDVFIYDIVDGSMYQFTNAPETDIAGDWSR